MQSKYFSYCLVAGFFLAVMANLIIGLIAIPAVISAVNPEPNPEYREYISIRDASNCTQTNDTYCREMYKICVHGYEYCQRLQCPGDLP